jgi:hypothetical protein
MRQTFKRYGQLLEQARIVVSLIGAGRLSAKAQESNRSMDSISGRDPTLGSHMPLLERLSRPIKAADRQR